MKKILFLAISFFLIQIVSAQESELLMETELVTSPDVSNPRFNGGELNKFYEFIDQEFNLLGLIPRSSASTFFCNIVV